MADRRRRSRPADLPRISALLALLAGGAPLATSMYLPALPWLTTSLHASSGWVQLSFSTFLVGVAAGQVVSGSMSDVLGRRQVLLAGSASFAGFSLLCAAAPDIHVLVGARFGEGAAGGCGVAVSRAVVSDVFPSRAASRPYAVLATAMGAAPLVAPLFGQAVVVLWSWRGVFVALAAVGFLQLARVLVGVPEHAVQRGHNALRFVVDVLSDRRLLGYAVSLSLCGAAAFAYIGGTTFLLHDVFGLSAAATSVVYGVNAAGSLGGSVLFGVLADRFEHRRIAITTSTVMLGSVTALSVLLATGIRSLAGTWGCLFLFVSTFGVFLPAMITMSQERGKGAAGTASSLLSGQFLVGAVVTALAAQFADGDGMPMAVTMTLCSTGATVTLFLAGREYQCHPI